MNRLVLIILEQICILILVKSTVCNEVSGWYNGTTSKEHKVVVCELKTHGIHSV